MTDDVKPKHAELFCHRCKASFSFEVGIKERVETRANIVGVVEHGIQCPNPDCLNWVHAYWMCVPLEFKRKELQGVRAAAGKPDHTQRDMIRFKDLQKKYAKAYQSFQNRMYKLTGVKPTMVKEHIVE